MQRLTKYPLLLAGILKYTAQTSALKPETQLLSAALERCRSFLEVYLYRCICVFVCIYIDVYIYICICVYVYIYICMCVCFLLRHPLCVCLYVLCLIVIICITYVLVLSLLLYSLAPLFSSSSMWMHLLRRRRIEHVYNTFSFTWILPWPPPGSKISILLRHVFIYICIKEFRFMC